MYTKHIIKDQWSAENTTDRLITMHVLAKIDVYRIKQIPKGHQNWFGEVRME